MGQVQLYDQPAYYDLALRNDFADEGALLQDCFRKHGPSPVEDILDVGCGTGRLIFDLVERGYRMVGYDRAPRMVEFARKGIEQRGIGGRARVLVGDMRACPLSKKFDAAINACEGLGYLRSDDEIIKPKLCPHSPSYKPTYFIISGHVSSGLDTDQSTSLTDRPSHR